MKRTKFHIEEYSAFAVCFLLLQTESSAEAVYSDIIPDTLIDFDWETFGIDMNNDGVVDFALLKRSFSFLETTYWSSYITSHLCIFYACLLYTSDAADERSSVDLGGRRIIKKKKNRNSISIFKNNKDKTYNILSTTESKI